MFQEKQGFTFSIENTFLETPQGEQTELHLAF